MSKAGKITVIVQSVKRIASSELGNPRFALTTDEGVYRTAPNSGVAYEITNYFRVNEKIPSVLARLTLDGYGNIIDVVKL